MIAAFSILVPAGRRSGWSQEWLAEIAYDSYRGNRPPAMLVFRCMGALVHALWLRKQEWRFEMLFQEIVYAFRVLRKKPGFTVIAVLVLALGIGANTAIFSVVHSVLWRSLPFHEPDKLVMVWSHNTRDAVFHNTVSPLDYRDFKAQNDVFSELAATTGRWGFTLTGLGDSESILGFWVSANWLQTLGVEPYIGRGIRAEEDRSNGNPVALVSYGFWQRRLGADPNVLQRSIVLDGRPYQVVGIMPAGFRFLEDGEERWRSLAPASTKPDRDECREIGATAGRRR
jgi:putative ABC transport system permease protein